MIESGAQHGAGACGTSEASAVAQNHALGAWFRICHFWVTRTCKERRPVRAGFRQAMSPVREAASLPRSSPLGLKRSQAQQGEPVWMALAGHQLPRAFALALGVPAAQEAAVVQEEPQQDQV